jgi:hypothetical protein
MHDFENSLLNFLPSQIAGNGLGTVVYIYALVSLTGYAGMAQLPLEVEALKIPEALGIGVRFYEFACLDTISLRDSHEAWSYSRGYCMERY